MNTHNLALCVFFSLATASEAGCHQQDQKIQQLEGTIAGLQKDLEASQKHVAELLRITDEEADLFGMIRKSHEEVVEGLKALKDEPRLYYNSPEGVELAKSGVELRRTGKHMAHLEKQILTMLKELDRSRAALEKGESST